MKHRSGSHRLETEGERPDRWPDELCEQCRAPDCNHMGPLWTCPWRKKMEADNGKTEQR